MLLVSYGFGFFFLVLAAVYYMAPDKEKKYVLLAFSLLFYLNGGGFYLLYPLLTAATTFFLAKGIGRMTERAGDKAVKKKQRRLLLLGLFLNFGILAVLKYMNFLLYNAALVLNAFGVPGEMEYGDWILPLGISYYTFQSMGYLIDIYNRKYEPESRFSNFLLFVLFFPQLIAGPISRYDQMQGEYQTAHTFKQQKSNIVSGLERMLWGYFKKLVIADRLAPAAAAITTAPETYNGIYFLIGMVFWTVQLYADFSGGMDIVIGGAQVLGIRLPENFDRPFFSRSLAELWRRWHMTLMQWFREYIFYPVSASGFCKKLSGPVKNRFGRKAARRVPVYTATILVWFITGIWHGASWNFIAWGMANCVVLLVSQELSGVYKSFHKRFSFTEAGWYHGFQMVRTFFVFAFLQMFIHYPFSMVFSMTGGLFTAPGFGQLFDGSFEGLGLGASDFVIVLLGIILMLVFEIFEEKESVRERLSKMPLAVQYLAVFFLFTAVVLFGVYGPGYDASQFIYNQF